MRRELAIIISYPTSVSGIIITPFFYCFIKNNQEMLIDLANFALYEQPEDKLMITISRAWYNGSYNMVAKAIKSLELHNTMIQFLIKKAYRS